VGARFEIIAGERRYRAAIEAGLRELPCVVRETSDAEMMELALVENLQRKDLTAFEEADGLKVLAEKYGYTHETMAEKLGKSRSSITETLSLGAMPEDVRQMCRLADIQSKSVLLQIVRQCDREKMASLVERLTREGATRVDARRLARKEAPRRGRGRPRHFTFRFSPKGSDFSFHLQFKRSQVEREEIIRTLEEILESLRKQH
jgi:ParB family chromosome partitioning protein